MNIIGKTFGRLRVVSSAPRRFVGGQYRSYVACICECGKEKEVKRQDLISGDCRSCGCLLSESSSKRLTKHGKAKAGEPEYYVWKAIKQRCLNPSNKNYRRYGGRGIGVCKEWLDDYQAFLKDMGHRPSFKHSIDRRDNNKGYSPENCYWATQEQQSKNRSNTIWVEYNGNSWSLNGLARHIGIDGCKLYYYYITKRKCLEEAIKAAS